MKLFFQILFVVALAVFGAGCSNSDQGEKGNKRFAPPEGAETGQAGLNPTLGSGFLSTGYDPLEKWMDERFKVRYENMPLEMVFEQKPISDIRYQKSGLPEKAPLFMLVETSISRREILKRIADSYNLHMHVEMAGGQPSYVVVRGKTSPTSGGSGRTSANTSASTGGAAVSLPSGTKPSLYRSGLD